MNPSETKLVEKIGANIRRIRKEKKMRQYTLAEISEMEKASLSRIETGQSNPTILTLNRLAEALSVDIAEFFK